MLVPFVLLLVLTLTGGCVECLVAPSVGLFGAGWLVGRLTTPTTTDTICYRNGEPIDCNDVLSEAVE